MGARFFLAVSIAPALWGVALGVDDVRLKLASQTETSPGSGRYHRLVHDEQWAPAQTAVIVCDAWDLHHSINAVRRLEEFAPRLDQVLAEARRRGAIIIHSPSDCMEAYVDHPARRRAQQTPPAERWPADIRSWCLRIPAEERATYPLDQSDGGDDDDPQEHAAWAAKLKSQGRNPDTPWQKQSELISIDPDRDYLSDRGDEVWNILQARGIRNVILTGVHTNMCVLGRPFGLRQMVRNGMRVVLMRDLTDTMYNPRQWPYVSHFTGTDLIVTHIERYVCPTITSDQLIGGRPFRFRQDTRPHLAIVIAEDEYQTERTLPAFAAKFLGKDFRVSLVFGSDRERNDIPGLDVLDEADLALVSVRRRVLRPEQMAWVRSFLSAGKPIVGIRTASHAFALGKPPLPDGYRDWPEFDAEVFGGEYHGHLDGRLKSLVQFSPPAANHPILRGISPEPFAQGGSLYQSTPVKGATVLATGRAEGQPPQPVAWTFQRADGGRSFYTSLGHPGDFEQPAFLRLLDNALHWAVGLPVDEAPLASGGPDFWHHWSTITVPGSWQAASGSALKNHGCPDWYRCVVRAPQKWEISRGMTLTLPAGKERPRAWFNGHPLAMNGEAASPEKLSIPAAWILPGDANLLVVRVEGREEDAGLREAPVLTCGQDTMVLKGRWQFRVGDDEDWANMPLPARFGTATDIVFDPDADRAK